MRVVSTKIKVPEQNPHSVFNKKVKKSFIIKEKFFSFLFAVSGAAALGFVILIFLFLLKEGIQAAAEIGFFNMLYFDAGRWSPNAPEPQYSIIPLIAGTLLTSIPAVIISSLFGSAAGIYLFESASAAVKKILVPAMKLLSGIPTVVLGFIMLSFGADLFYDLFNPANRLNAFVAAAGLSTVIIPSIAIMTMEALQLVPPELRNASYALGASKFQTLKRVVMPYSVKNITAGILLGFGRAAGETMIVLMAAGNAANLTTDIFKSVRTMAASIGAEMGEVTPGSEHYLALFFTGLVLFVFTFVINTLAGLLIKKSGGEIG